MVCRVSRRISCDGFSFSKHCLGFILPRGGVILTRVDLSTFINLTKGGKP